MGPAGNVDSEEAGSTGGEEEINFNVQHYLDLRTHDKLFNKSVCFYVISSLYELDPVN